ncbi:tol [Pyrenophora seminiperda CCB06]|uniref:Tol n=1 Tax=Pyrenophora seminiperda CCB06 TaxID=1302712 RepID=A0A3M7M673_9PLEO|nr:tol [Pyrenophora seminiperda CCB06]
MLTSNIDTCYESIDYTGLSQNMQDAITTTISLGFSYIWIDSLCIIQRDDKGEEVGETAEIWKTDWRTEARKMGSVYSGAACTIASTGSSTSTGGCFHSRSPMSLEPCKIGVSSVDALSPHWIYARRDDVFDFDRNVDQAPLNTRSWVMQERLLSRRILHFGADMIYWECCLRSASELCPHGYTYKRYPEDFKDNYSPNLKGQISTRGEMQKAERRGRGIRWANIEAVRLRPPPVITDSDSPITSQAVWQQKRGFWRNVLKSNDGLWVEDERDGKSSNTRAGFRAAFEKLRSGSPNNVERVGRESASQVWYDVVESYSRGKLTSPTDKLIALKGIEDEIARARHLTYLHGLWEQQLPTDLLWFAIEGPGRRLLNEDDIPVAPTWSWASIEAIVALDLLPDTSLDDIKETETLVTVNERPSWRYEDNIERPAAPNLGTHLRWHIYLDS